MVSVVRELSSQPAAPSRNDRLPANAQAIVLYFVLPIAGAEASSAAPKAMPPTTEMTM